MNRTSFVGALIAVALGAVLAFAVQSTPKDLDLHVTGLIILVAGLADLAIRFLIADSPLLSPRAAAVAAVVEPLGEPVLDVFGNPIAPAPSSRAADPYIVSPEAAAAAASFTMPVVDDPIYPDRTGPLLDLGPGDLSPDQLGLTGEETRERAMAHARARDQALYEQAVAAASDGVVPDSTVPATTLTGRPIRPRRRRRISP